MPVFTCNAEGKKEQCRTSITRNKRASLGGTTLAARLEAKEEKQQTKFGLRFKAICCKGAP